jgi:hypothetical protein
MFPMGEQKLFDCNKNSNKNDLCSPQKYLCGGNEILQSEILGGFNFLFAVCGITGVGLNTKRHNMTCD